MRTLNLWLYSGSKACRFHRELACGEQIISPAWVRPRYLATRAIASAVQTAPKELRLLRPLIVGSLENQRQLT